MRPKAIINIIPSEIRRGVAFSNQVDIKVITEYFYKKLDKFNLLSEELIENLQNVDKANISVGDTVLFLVDKNNIDDIYFNLKINEDILRPTVIDQINYIIFQFTIKKVVNNIQLVEGVTSEFTQNKILDEEIINNDLGGVRNNLLVDIKGLENTNNQLTTTTNNILTSIMNILDSLDTSNLPYTQSRELYIDLPQNIKTIKGYVTSSNSKTINFNTSSSSNYPTNLPLTRSYNDARDYLRNIYVQVTRIDGDFAPFSIVITISTDNNIYITLDSQASSITGSYFVQVNATYTRTEL